MIIDLYYFDGCPSWTEGLANLKSALELESIDAEIRLVLVEDNREAERLQFLGSPSFKVDGVDLWPEVRSSYSLSCRVYPTQDGLRGAPSVDMLQKKLHAFRKS